MGAGQLEIRGNGVAGTVVDAARVGERMLGPGVFVMCGPQVTWAQKPTPTPPFRTTPGKGPDRDA